MDADDDPLPGRHVDLAEARAWSGEQFHDAGRRYGVELPSVLPSDLLDQQLDRFSVATVLGNLGTDELPALGRDAFAFSIGVTDRAASQVLRWMLARGGRTLVVEDDLGSRTDVGVGDEADTAFVDDRVLRWCPLTITCREAADLLRRGAAGYPRNTYVCDQPADVLGLEAGRSLGPDTVAGLAAHAVALVTSVWDDACYVVLWTPDRDAG